MLTGVIGCFLPVLPGPPISYVGLLLLQLLPETPFSTRFMIIWLLVTVGVTVLDYVIPAYGTKKYGGSRWGVAGTFIGLIIGVFFAPAGIILGPLLGALVGEYLAGKNSQQAFKAALGSFVGFLLGSLIKLIACMFMFYYYFSVLI